MEATYRRKYITTVDQSRIGQVLASKSGSEAHLERLRQDLDQAIVVTPEEVPSNVVTLDSRFRLRDLDSGEEGEYRLVTPRQANIRQGSISVLAPVGAALLGSEELEVVTYHAPAGTRRFRVESVLYQPESAETLGA